jgi:pyridoxine 5'-phosphate synthase PdxJ
LSLGSAIFALHDLAATEITSEMHVLEIEESNIGADVVPAEAVNCQVGSRACLHFLRTVLSDQVIG